MLYSAATRALAIALATLLVFLLLLLREATSPSGEGYWPAMAPAPGGALYLADQRRHELRLISSTEVRRVAPLPVAIYRALAADGPSMLLAGEGHLYVSNDAGRTWRAALVGRFTAVTVRGSLALAGAWGDALWRSEDSGATWARATVPVDDTEFEAIVPGFAATLLGLLSSADGGRSWEHVGSLPDRVTSISEGERLAVGDWRGTVWELSGQAWRPRAHYSGGISSLAGAVVATTGGLYHEDQRVPGYLGSREVSRVVVSEGSFFAAVARGPIYFSADGIAWRSVYQG